MKNSAYIEWLESQIAKIELILLNTPKDIQDRNPKTTKYRKDLLGDLKTARNNYLRNFRKYEERGAK